MEFKIVVTIDNLTADSVSVKSQEILIRDGAEIPLGEPHRKSYVNSDDGKTELAAEVPEPYFSGVIAVWGDTATVQDYDDTVETGDSGESNENIKDSGD